LHGLSVSAGTHRLARTPFAEIRDRPSGCFSNEYRQQLLRIEVLDAKRQIHRAFARPAARGRDRGEMRWRPSEVDLCWCRAPERLMRAEVRVVDEAQRTTIPIAALRR
jgi:hypothetical protein